MNPAQTTNAPTGATGQKKGFPLWNYLKGAVVELRKVSWPSRHETWKKAKIVIVFSAAFAVFLGAMDYLFNLLLQIVL